MKVKTSKYTPGTHNLIVEYGEKPKELSLMLNIDYKEVDSNTIELLRDLNPAYVTTRTVRSKDMKTEIHIEDFGVENQRGVRYGMDQAEYENKPIRVDGEWFWIYKQNMNEKRMYDLGYKHGKEEIQESLRELIGIK